MKRLRAVVTGAIQLVAVQERAAAAGITSRATRSPSPPPCRSRTTSSAWRRARSPDDETAAYAHVASCCSSPSSPTGKLVLTGVVEEKSSRVVEVLLARMPARNLLAGKVAGIGLLGFAQFAVTALAALVATMAVDSVDIPAVSGGVLAWVVVWFVLGYAMYARRTGRSAHCASQTEDASSVAGPVSYRAHRRLLGLVHRGQPGTPKADGPQVVSFFPRPRRSPMPGRIALGATAVVGADRSRPPLTLRRHRRTRRPRRAGVHRRHPAHRRHGSSSATPGGAPRLRARAPRWPMGSAGIGRWLRASVAKADRRRKSRTVKTTTDDVTTGALILAAGLAAVVAVLGDDVVIGLAVGAAFFAVTTRIARAWAGRRGHPSHP